jgi:hypothetical protein
LQFQSAFELPGFEIGVSVPLEYMAQGKTADGIRLLHEQRPLSRVGGQIQGLQDSRFAAAVQDEEHSEGGQRDASGLNPTEPADLQALNDR